MKTVIIAALVYIGLFGPVGARASVEEPARIVAIVSVSQQQMEVVIDRGASRETYSWKVSTAGPGYVTPRGTYQPTWLSRHHRSRQYDNAPMPFAVFFHNGYAVHATDAVSRLGTPASHGCVRLAPENAATFFDLVAANGNASTEIVIVD